MDITPLGFILIPLGLIILLFKPKLLLWISIITIPFEQVVLIEFPIVTFRLTIFLYFALLLIIYFFLTIVSRSEIYPITRIEIKILTFFVWFTLLSLAMPIILEGKVLVHPIDAPTRPIIYEELKLRRTNLTQLCYVIFQIFYFIVLLNYFRDKSDVRKAIFLFSLSCLFVLLTGLLGQLLRILGLYSIYFKLFSLFSEVRFIHSEVGGIPVMFTIYGEPGDSAILFSCMVGFLLSSTILGAENIFRSKKLDFLLLLVFFVSTLMGGTAGVIGLIMVLLFGNIFVILPNSPHKAKIKMLGLSISVAFTVILTNLILISLTHGSLFEHIEEWHFGRLFYQEASYKTRANYTTDGLNMFLKYPLLGVGIGSNKGKGMITYLLSNVGLLGTSTFMLLCYILSRKSILMETRIPEEVEGMGKTVFLGFIGIFTGIMLTGGWGVNTTYIMWFMLAVMAGLSNIYEEVISNG